MGERKKRANVRTLVAAVAAAAALAACTVERTPDGIQICYYTSAGIACTLEPESAPMPTTSSQR